MMQPTTSEIVRQAELLCRGVAKHDFDGVPLYIVPASSLPDGMGRGNRLDGFTQPSLDLYVQDYIDNWQGRGACMVINDTLLRRISGGAFDTDFLGIALHELAHILERKTPYQPRPNADRRTIKREAASVAKCAAAPLSQSFMERPWRHHEGKFLRIAFHLHHRANWFGVRLHATQIYETEMCGLSPATAYADAVADEATRMKDASFREILATKFPKTLSHLWTSDVVRWFESQPKSEKETA